MCNDAVSVAAISRMGATFYKRRSRDKCSDDKEYAISSTSSRISEDKSLHESNESTRQITNLSEVMKLNSDGDNDDNNEEIIVER